MKEPVKRLLQTSKRKESLSQDELETVEDTGPISEVKNIKFADVLKLGMTGKRTKTKG